MAMPHIALCHILPSCRSENGEINLKKPEINKVVGKYELI